MNVRMRLASMAGLAAMCALAAGVAARAASGRAGKVAIKAYINVSSGCQDDTVRVLKELARRYENVSLEIVDFGRPKGFEEWQKAGYGCMTILLNGHHTVTIGKPGHRRVVRFLKPAGFLWSHDDLRRAVQAGLRGTLYLGKEKGASETIVQALNAEVTARRVKKGDDTLADVFVNDAPVFRLAASQGAYNPFRRAELVAVRLQQVFDKGLNLQSLAVGDNKGNPCIRAGDVVIVTAYPDDAKHAKLKPGELVQQWGGNLVQAIIKARRR
ncbi:MAG: hypothetical protein ACE5O2_00410 [Armatimonadota bacterium]